MAVGAGGAATAAAVAAKVVPQQVEEKQAAAGTESNGYRASEHIRNYYRTAQV